MKNIRKVSLYLSAPILLTFLTGLFLKNEALWQPSLVFGLALLTIGLGAIEKLAGYQYTGWIIVAVVAGLTYPQNFTQWGDFNLRDKFVILCIVQLVMFGMGTKMSIKDFSAIGNSGKGVLVGLVSHFTVMPTVGYLLTRIFHFEPEIAAGVILIGCCSSGLASNVMVYIAKANLILSVTVTAVATIVAPFLTPLLMKLLAGALIEVKFSEMMQEIIKIVIIPISAALFHDYLKTADAKGKKTVFTLFGIAAVWLVIFGVFAKGYSESNFGEHGQEAVVMFTYLMGAIIVGVLYHQLYRMYPKLDKIMPYFSMFGIIYFTLVSTAAGRDNLLQVGFILFLAAAIHNALGYFFGYWMARALKMNKPDARTIAFEVGLQNGGMASGIAGSMGKLGTVGLAAAVFSPWMNISGSILANYWGRKAEREKRELETDAANAIDDKKKLIVE